ncbi:5-oxoprolinase subunit PxpB [Aureibaculum conchae]|uniref:5-oxoprolinase subunit PxpB n=1 Tax=Aureibaculum sp. 2308TA14-22 TaxID=3108392 RepID=UPI003396E194
MGTFKLTYKRYGKNAILIEWPKKIDKNILDDVIFFKNKVIQNYTKQIVDVINTYNSLTIIYNNTINIVYDNILDLKSLYGQEISQKKVKNYRWEIPVCYDYKFGLDLGELGLKNNLTLREIISLHSSQIYTVYFIGFLPGFLYLGGLDKKLHIPRKANPRLRIERGSVAIGGSQTGIYPSMSASGWHIIGNSPISFFDIEFKDPCFAKSGDEIQFIPIDLDEHFQIESQVAKGFYELKKSEI